ncbi:hypothetical protein [Leptospirillum ferriphilum]|uniref:Uncharacterized protein n=1 Tax=Leptospirillum ferriphilum TaxID=178606 RepID=A0A2I2MHI2_9BACT|nr:hypothetical protein [Leptospirillum ferriphilum]
MLEQLEQEEQSRQESLENALRSGRQVLTQIDIYRGRIIETTSIYNMDKIHRRVTVGHT